MQDLYRLRTISGKEYIILSEQSPHEIIRYVVSCRHLKEECIFELFFFPDDEAEKGTAQKFYILPEAVESVMLYY